MRVLYYSFAENRVLIGRNNVTENEPSTYWAHSSPLCMLSFRLIGSDALRYVFLDVVVEEWVVVFVVAGRPEEFRICRGRNSGGSHDNTAGEVDLSVNIEMLNLIIASFLV